MGYKSNTDWIKLYNDWEAQTYPVFDDSSIASADFGNALRATGSERSFQTLTIPLIKRLESIAQGTEGDGAILAQSALRDLRRFLTRINHTEASNDQA